MSLTVAVCKGSSAIDLSDSLLSAQALIDALQQLGVTVRDIFIDGDGQWHERGREVGEDSVLTSTDLVFETLGSRRKMLAALCEQFNVPLVGSDSFATGLANNRELSRTLCEREGVSIVSSESIFPDDNGEVRIHSVISSMPFPLFITASKKSVPLSGVIARSYGEMKNAVSAITNVLENAVIHPVSERTVSVTVLDNFRGEKTYTFPILECTKEVAALLKDNAIKVHNALSLRDYSTSHFAITDRGVRYLDTDTSVSFHKGSRFVQNLSAIGGNIQDFVSHLLKQRSTV
jgi:D-alanine-D-alanine ligase-like ATP-grasp enzyme